MERSPLISDMVNFFSFIKYLSGFVHFQSTAVHAHLQKTYPGDCRKIAAIDSQNQEGLKEGKKLN